VSWLDALRARRTADADLADEIRQHLDEKIDALVSQGLAPDEAAARAHREFGNVALVGERSRAIWRWTLLDDAWADARYALRQLRRSPSFAVAAVLTLGIGIGANAAIFSVADRALLNPLPFRNAERLVTVNEVVPLIADRPIRLPAPDLVDYEHQSRAFDAIGGWRPRAFEVSGGHESERVQGVRATASFFDVLQVRPALGRAFTIEEDDSSVAVVVISDGLWRRWFGADPGVLGQTVHLDRMPYRIIGVMPRGFEFPLRGTETTSATDLWVPMSLTPGERQARGDNWDYNGIARLRPGTTVAQASADVNRIAQEIIRELPPDRSGLLTFRALVQPLGEQLSRTVRPLLLALVGAVACVLLITCVNVANLLLARGARREKEVAVRVALGASRGRIVRQLISETAVLALLAAVLGGLLAWGITGVLSRAVPARFALLAQASFSWRLTLFIAAIALTTAVLVAIVPGLAATRGRRMDALNERGTSADGVRHQRLRSALIVAETALALVLLVGAGLLVRSFRDLLGTGAGFRPERGVAGYISLPEQEYPDAVRERQAYRTLLERLRTRPGVQFAGIGVTLPLRGSRFERAFTPDQYRPPKNARFNIAAMTTIGGTYLQAIGATLIRGRYFTAEDREHAAPVAIVTQSVAQQYWPGQDPIGKRLKWGIVQSPAPWLTVVGMVADVKQNSLDEPGAAQIYVPADQAEDAIVAELEREFTIAQLRSMFIVVRGDDRPEALLGALRDAVHGLDARLAVANLEPLTDTVAASAAPQRFNMLLMAGLAAMALLLAAIGIYGVVAYSVAQRTQEIGIRLALGADGGAVVGMIVRRGMALAGLGVVIGTCAAAALAPLLGALLFGVKPLDPPTFASVALLLLGVAALATYVPARRATKVDPMLALRSE
jgi:putative ABC transport system permease protein